MTKESRDRAAAVIASQCGQCVHATVCKYKDTFGTATRQAIHEVQSRDYLIEVYVNCKYFTQKERDADG